jgi:hypothetical protein
MEIEIYFKDGSEKVTTTFEIIPRIGESINLWSLRNEDRSMRAFLVTNIIHVNNNRYTTIIRINVEEINRPV